MSFDRRYSLYEKISHQPGYGIPADNIGTLKTNAEYAEQLRTIPKEFQAHWTDVDTFLTRHFGTNVDYRKEIRNASTNWRAKPVKTVGRYSAEPILQKLKTAKSPLSEQDIADEIYKIQGSCNLRGTTARSFPQLHEIGETLTLDTDSPLEDLGALKKVGKIDVIAKNVKEMDKFLMKIGIMSPEGKILPDIADDIYLVMKNYL